MNNIGSRTPSNDLTRNDFQNNITLEDTHANNLYFKLPVLPINNYSGYHHLLLDLPRELFDMYSMYPSDWRESNFP